MYWMYVLDLISRYLHIACSTVLVGGTLFYEMVVPAAIDELKTEQQLDVFGRARWVFKRLVWTSAILLVLSGAISTRKHWASYKAEPIPSFSAAPDTPDDAPSVFRRPGWWWAAHVSTGALAVLIAVYLTTVARPPDHPIGWMRLNLVILLIVMFLASATRHARLFNADTMRGRVVIPFVMPEEPD
ncbi:MAG: hypothetical protein WBD40_05825 [Tepidisphaeraceae bacterium]